MILLEAVLSFFIGLFGIVTLVIISKLFKSNRILNVYLVILLLFTSFRFILFGYLSLNNSLVTQEYNLIAFFSAFFPCVYLYFKNLAFHTNKFKKTELLHFILPLTTGIILFVLDSQFDSLILVGHIFFIIIGAFYITLSYVLLKNHLWHKKSSIIEMDKHNALIKSWSIFFFIICLLLITRVLIVTILDLYLNTYSFGRRYLYISFIITFIFYIKVLTSPEILYGYSFFSAKVEEQRNVLFTLNDNWILDKRLSITNIQDLELSKKIADKLFFYITEIESAALKNNLLREQTVNLSEFANHIEIPKSHVVHIFKYHSNLSFIEFRKLVRTLDAINLIENNFLNLNTLDCLAKKVGYSSYNTFFTSFKEYTGMTPRFYLQEFANKVVIQTKLT